MTAPTELTKLLDITELADVLGVPRTWVRDKVTARQIPFTRVGRHVRFDQEDIDAIVAAGKQPAMSGSVTSPVPRSTFRKRVPPAERPQITYGTCPICDRSVGLKQDGVLRVHGRRPICRGSSQEPAATR